VVLTGTGDRGFSAGGDINRMAEGLDDHARWCASMPEAREIVLNILECDKPVIGRINGHAIGLGASIALCCDLTVMVEDAKIGDTHVKVGLVAGDGGSLLWPYLVGWMQAKRYLLTGDLLTGKQAAEIGLVTFAVPPEELDGTVNHWADRFANGPTRAISLTKRSLNMAIRQQAQVFMDAQLGLETMSHLSHDHREAVTAFRDKREPQFTGL
jgi:enoyl-CoA hydratase